MCHHLYFNEKDPARKLTGVYLHLASGHEATHLGAVKAMREDDHVITAYRDHGIAIARGVDPNLIMAEMKGKRTGVSGGKGGSMHLASREHNFWGGYAIVGGHLPLATGIALKCRYMDEPNAVLCFCGDGATNNGYFRIEESSGQTELVKRAIAYGMKEGPRVDGQNVVEVYEAVKEALDYSREHGPVLMEALTYRFSGHGVSDKQYDEREDLRQELEVWRERDPILVLREQLTRRFKKLDDDFARIEEETTRIVDESVEFMVNSPSPTYEDLIANVYVNGQG
jgi:pyruvate dehydrogenase E1 component alpha subunit